MTAALSAPMPARETIAVVRGTKSEQRDELVALGRKLADECHEAGMHRGPQLDAAACALLLEDAPYVSVAHKAHTLCIEAIEEDLYAMGGVDPSLNALASALADLLRDSGLRFRENQWEISLRARDANARCSFPAALAWDVDGRDLEVAP